MQIQCGCTQIPIVFYSYLPFFTDSSIHDGLSSFECLSASNKSCTQMQSCCKAECQSELSFAICLENVTDGHWSCICGSTRRQRTLLTFLLTIYQMQLMLCAFWCWRGTLLLSQRYCMGRCFRRSIKSESHRPDDLGGSKKAEDEANVAGFFFFNKLKRIFCGSSAVLLASQPKLQYLHHVHLNGFSPRSPFKKYSFPHASG